MRGRPGIPPGVYFRIMMVGYLEGIGSERGIAWRVCGLDFAAGVSGITDWRRTGRSIRACRKTRKRLGVEAHAAVFGRVLELLKASGLLSGKTLGVDSTTLEANAAMRSIVRRAYGKGLRGVAGGAGPEATGEGLERGLGASQRPGGPDREDEGRQDPSGAQVRAGGQHGDRGARRRDGADDGRRRRGGPARERWTRRRGSWRRWGPSRRRWWPTRATTRTRP